jgi:NAD(P)-dependent dehydrogenase (short-subunit alcohol dehydrogenase family)
VLQVRGLPDDQGPRGGSIVSISSGAALRATPTFGAYAVSKAGIHALNTVLAADLGGHGISANVIVPVLLETARIDMLRAQAAGSSACC